METRLEITETAVPEAVRRIRHRVADTAAEAGVSETAAEEIGLCVGEAVSNVVRHAYRDAGGVVHVLVGSDENVVVVTVEDWGVGFPESGSAPGDGFGLKIIGKLARDVTFSSDPSNGTEVRMTFPLADAVDEASGRLNGRPGPG
jgi:serine/threonine-protein kinase RsbW